MEIYVYPIMALLFAAIFTREVIAPASRNACDKRWQILAGGLTCATLAVTIAIGYAFSSQVKESALLKTDAYSDFAVGVTSFLITSFIFYWWHRLTHASDLLWRIFHQLHHSARRVEALTAFYSHPMDVAAATSISAISSYLLLGASSLAAAIALLLTGMLDLFVHADINTPKWLGYFIQRPEMHSLHHKRNHHRNNYGLPIWDLLFGTWVNPATREHDLGFDPQRSDKVYEMLSFKNTHT